MRRKLELLGSKKNLMGVGEEKNNIFNANTV